MALDTPWVIEPDDLDTALDEPNTCVIDLSSPELYQLEHIPTAISLDYSSIVKNTPPVLGLIPDAAEFERVLSERGITPDSYIIAYDAEGSGKAARLLWTLEIAGHKKMSLLNGGINAWKEQNKPTTTEIPKITSSIYKLSFYNREGVVDAEEILTQLVDAKTCVLDARSRDEYLGKDVRAKHAGHIPGAVNLDWIELKDRNNPLRLKPENELQQMLEAIGITKEKNIITHCQSHHRSALMYVTLKSLGFEHVKGYPGSWSDWANRDDTPIEI